MLILESCGDRATELRAIFEDVAPDRSSAPTRFRRYYRAFKANPKSDKVRTLMDGIFMDLQLLAANRSVNGATREQVNRLLDSSSGKDGPPRAARGGSRSQTFYNTGSGIQIVHSGTGELRISTGTGLHVSGDIGTLNFGVPFR